MRVPWTGRRAAFQYPVPPAPRTAVLVDWFESPRVGSPVQCFAEGWTSEAAAFAPAALAGTREQILRLAAHHSLRLTHAVVVLARPGDPLTSAEERDLLWRAFGVPVFEQIIGADGRLLAAECEAHDGLHLLVAGRSWEGYEVDTSPCGCGQTPPRLHFRALVSPAPRAAHAGAARL